MTADSEVQQATPLPKLFSLWEVNESTTDEGMKLCHCCIKHHHALVLQCTTRRGKLWKPSFMKFIPFPHSSFRTTPSNIYISHTTLLCILPIFYSIVFSFSNQKVATASFRELFHNPVSFTARDFLHAIKLTFFFLFFFFFQPITSHNTSSETVNNPVFSLTLYI